MISFFENYFAAFLISHVNRNILKNFNEIRHL